MIVCHCRAVNDKRIAEVVASGARCPEDVMRACGAAGRCGGCLPLVETLVVQFSDTCHAADSDNASAA